MMVVSNILREKKKIRKIYIVDNVETFGKYLTKIPK